MNYPNVSGTRMTLKTQQFGGEVNIFDSQQIRYVRGGITIDHKTVAPVDVDGIQRRILLIGTPMGKITDTGKYGPYDKDATDGRQKACLILCETLDVTTGDCATTACDMARIIEARCPVPITAAIKNDLKHIAFV